jgi:cation:H+ antiporter
LGNVIGSNIANVGLILGISGLIVPIAVKSIMIRREIPILISVSIVMFLLATNGNVDRLDGIILLIGGILFNMFFFVQTRRDGKELTDQADEFSDAVSHTHEEINRNFEVIRVVIGVALLAAGAQAMVEGATHIATEVGVSDIVIGITLVAFGTSLPELAASITAAMRYQTDILVGNIIGSNIYNILLVLGLTAVIKPVPVPNSALEAELPFMVIYACLLLPFALDRILSRREAVFLFGSYAAFTLFVVVR